jgi:hypothetical protein
MIKTEVVAVENTCYMTQQLNKKAATEVIRKSWPDDGERLWKHLANNSE